MKIEIYVEEGFSFTFTYFISDKELEEDETGRISDKVTIRKSEFAATRFIPSHLAIFFRRSSGSGLLSEPIDGLHFYEESRLKGT